MSRVFALLATMVAWSIGFAQAPAASERPSIKVGDRWSYKTVDLLTNNVLDESAVEVTAVESDIIRTRTTRAQRGETEDVYDSQWNAKRQAGRDFSPARALLAFPLESGKTWEARVTYPNMAGDAKISSTLKGTVSGWESVTVPAGTFKAQKISVTNSYFAERGPSAAGRRNSGVGEWTIWYAPEVKRFVRLEYNEERNRTRTDLVEYKLN